MSILCKLGLHIMNGHTYAFTDIVSGKSVYYANCPCNKKWLVDTLFPLPSFKVESAGSEEIHKN